MGWIMLVWRTPLYIFSAGTVTVELYRYEILELYIRLFWGAVGDKFVFVDNNEEIWTI